MHNQELADHVGEIISSRLGHIVILRHNDQIKSETMYNIVINDLTYEGAVLYIHQLEVWSEKDNEELVADLLIYKNERVSNTEFEILTPPKLVTKEAYDYMEQWVKLINDEPVDKWTEIKGIGTFKNLKYVTGIDLAAEGESDNSVTVTFKCDEWVNNLK